MIGIDETISICPHCGIGMKPSIIKDIEYTKYHEQVSKLAVLQCPVCKKYFFVDYTVVYSLNNQQNILKSEIYPKPVAKIKFDDRLEKIYISYFLYYI